MVFMNNIHTKFWTLFGGLYSLICTFIFIIYCGTRNDTITIGQEWCFIFLPVLLYLIWQFVYNYCELDEKNKE